MTKKLCLKNETGLHTPICHCEGFSPWQSNEIASHSFAMTSECGRSALICHPEVLTEGSIDSSHSFRMTQCETGRSMIEMLGVLAVMGVLSVAGIAGYNSAMNKHRANELLNEASKRAVVVAGQFLNRDTASLAEFSGHNSVAGATFTDTTATKDANNQFTLTITGVSEAVCNHMQNMKTALIQKFEPSDCATTATVKLTYNADLSVENSSAPSGGNESGTTTPQSPTCDPECTGGRECVADNTCACPDDKPIWNGSECQVKATCDAGQYYFVGSNFCDEEQVCDEAVQYSNYTKNTTNKTCTCPSGTYGYLWMDSSYDCCPEGYPIIMGKCATSKTCDGTWYCNGELDDNGNCIDNVECCEGEVITEGNWQECLNCKEGEKVYCADVTACMGALSCCDGNVVTFSDGSWRGCCPAEVTAWDPEKCTSPVPKEYW